LLLFFVHVFVCTLDRRLKIQEKSANLANFEIIIAHFQTKFFLNFLLTLDDTSRIRFVPNFGTSIMVPNIFIHNKDFER